MVKGIELFAGHFKGFEDSYVLIGGSACDLWMQTPHPIQASMER
jgi:hypothetical protein